MGARSGHLPLDEHESAWGDRSSARLSYVDRPSDRRIRSRRCLELRRILQQDEADLVHAVNWFASGYCLLAKPRRARVISSIRNSHLPVGLVHRTIFPPLVRRAAGVLVNSERGRQLVVGTCKVPPARVAVVPNGMTLTSGGTTGRPAYFAES